MAFSRLVFTVLFLSVTCYAIDVPVFLWGDIAKTSSKANPLETLSAPEFTAVVKEELASDPLTVVFVDETLSVEDLSRKNDEGETAYGYLHSQLGNSIYLPSVDGPLAALNKLADPSNVDHVKLTENGLSAEISSDETKFWFINLKDAKEGESRDDLLSRHDNFMKDTVEKLRENHKKVVAVYTAHYPSWVVPETHSRVRRQANSNITTPDDYILNGLRFYVHSIQIREANNTINLNGIPSSQTEFNDTLNTMNTSVTFGDNSFIMNFRQKAGYWFFDSVTFEAGTVQEENLKPVTEVYALMDFSYRCAQMVVFNSLNISRSLVFEDMQIQPYFTTTNESFVFGDTFDCVGFFSAAIWAGLMVTFLLLSITFFGIIMMMDIRTMDRFDDPKGKTITINTSE